MISEQTRCLVWERAGRRCEYCLLAESDSLWRLEIEHIIPRKHKGDDQIENLALACTRCNLGKSSNLTGIDPLTKVIVELFNPRQLLWPEHFRFEKVRIEGISPCGRATVDVLNMNEPARLRLRREFSAKYK